MHPRRLQEHQAQLEWLLSVAYIQHQNDLSARGDHSPNTTPSSRRRLFDVPLISQVILEEPCHRHHLDPSKEMGKGEHTHHVLAAAYFLDSNSTSGTRLCRLHDGLLPKER